MASGTGSATIDFGTGSQEASVTIIRQYTISATSSCEAWFMGDDTSSNHTADDHKYAPLFIALTCSTPIAGTGFTIYGRARDKMTGQFTLRWVWSD